ncbi:N-acetylglucosaminyl phosphatidylinositol deacetylase [Penicillium cf. griseofulvum]|uniref:N-acetylglucosaminylphosphatidylinositol deacetylase n=1 Tax=Penicillium cf. griseofulvum TaxID=2972120 RepID=A0A9W9J2V5_9EURO|nr:N-acetylglucosaminyl phosphatidylinositol deacetylase [Penicillium cf. griseofulvum]KAJ5434377.1 N-acetylglucosaminyl phosphatidylinositol deacetylase [Penicillium cf. griseofulvum]KAJ5452208.1 N-acetylglucosaminyl phosphatidylinositol deacetylase [Penicillium cf. griseofulvum]
MLTYHLADDPRLVPETFRHARRPILIVAHPDDETLFFSPSILYHRHDPHVTRSLLVISSGNYNGIGEQRQTEIHKSCAALGISQDHCVVLDLPDLQDNPKKWWDENLIQDIIAPYIEKWQADLIMTFDQGGISGHINHRAVSAGIRSYVATNEYVPPAYALQSISLLRKYSSLIDLIPSTIPFSWKIIEALLKPATNPDSVGRSLARETGKERVLLVSSWQTYLESRAAFGQHESQYSWDRVLYLVMSRYMWFNTLERIG